MERLAEELGQRDDLDAPEKIGEELIARGVLTEWQTNKLIEGKHKGFVLGPYCIMKPLGQGGMGTVYLARHSVMRRLSAIKVLPSRSSQEDPSLLDRFYREAQAVAALDHPNIVRAYDLNKDVRRNTVVHYLVMEYVEGQDLQAKVDQGGVLPYREAAEYVRQSAEGLAHAHEAGLVHRDIKPANLLVDRKGVVKVLDLGLALFYEEGQGTGLTNRLGDTVLGTVDYLAPEQAIDCHDVDARADIYSLGQTFYFLLTGRPPYPEGSVAQRLMAHQTKPADPIENQRPDAPPHLVAIIDRMTAKKREDRHQTAHEVAECLAAWLANQSSDSGFLPRVAPLRPAYRPSSSSTPTRLLPPTARPSSVPDDTRRSRASSVEDTEAELQLAPLDDEGPSPRPSSVGQSGASKDAGKSADDDKAASGSGAAGPSGDSQAKPSEETAQPQPEAGPELDGLSAPQDDWMSSLLDDESLAGAAAEAPPRPLPSLSKPDAKKGDAKKGKAESPESPWGKPIVWGGIAGAAAIVLILVIVLNSGPARDESPRPTASRPSAAPAGAPVAPSADGQAEQTPAEGVAASAEPSQPNGESAPAAPSEKSASSPPDEAEPAAGAPGAAKEPATDRGAAPAGEPDGRPQPRREGPRAREPRDAPPAGQDDRRPPPGAGQVKPGAEEAAPGAKPEAQPKAKPAPPDPAELRARFAAISQLSFQLESADRNPMSKLNMAVKQEAIQAAERAGLAIVKGDSVVMHLTLKTAQADGMVAFVMSAEVTCRDADSEPVTVWDHQDEIATVSPYVLRRPTLPSPIRSGLNDFFAHFVRDYRKANAKQDGTNPPDRRSGARAADSLSH